MANELLPPTDPDDSEGSHHPKRNSKDNAANSKGNNLPLAYGDILQKIKPAFRFIGWVVLIELISLFLAHFAGVVSGGFSKVLHIISLCGEFLPIALFIYKAGVISRRGFWILYAFISLFISGYILSMPQSNVTTSPEIGKLSTNSLKEIQLVLEKALKNSQVSNNNSERFGISYPGFSIQMLVRIGEADPIL